MDTQALLLEAQNFQAENKEQLDAFKSRFLGKKGVLNDLFANMKQVAPELRKSYGQEVNAIKQAAEEKI
ncbi:MAG: phenylalanine--tRNA ligase subunit alpha, partial [Bacteroidota bacterium]